MQKLSIYLGDLSHDSIGLATEIFPLNIGYIGAYMKKLFGDQVELKLFKYIPQLEDAIAHNPPDILMLSNYPWCHNIGLALFRELRERRPDSLRIMGGPNFPHLAQLQEEFLLKRPEIDAHAYLEGEIPIANLIRFVFETGDLKKVRDRMRGEQIPGMSYLNFENRLAVQPQAFRLENVEDVPSPYLTGLLDPFFDGRLSPMMQTNRGCPFTCTYCADGTKLVTKIHHFSLERVKAEIKYIAERVPKNIKALFLSDLNYGMYPRDAEISQEIARNRQLFDYPHYVEATTGKNSREKIIENVEILSGTLQVGMSIQSMDPNVLKNINRENMRLDQFLGLKPALKKAGLPTASEVILGLPGETRETHVRGLGDLLDMEIDNVFSWTLMLLNGSELNTPAQKALWDYKTKFRIIPRDFTKLKSGKKVMEIEEVIVDTKTLPFEDYVYCRKFILLLVATNNIGFRPLMRFCVQNKMRLINVLQEMYAILEKGSDQIVANHYPDKLRFYFKEFERETREELWDSEEEIVDFFQSNENFQGLLEGRYGANLLQTYKARVWSHAFEQLADLCFAVLKKQAKEAGRSELLQQIDEIEKCCRGRTFNLLGPDRMNTNPEVELNWDFFAWVEDPESRPLDYFKLQTPKYVRFELTPKQFEIVEDSLNQFGHNDIGKGKVLIRISPNVLWRNCTEITPAQKAPGFYDYPLSHPVRS